MNLFTSIPPLELILYVTLTLFIFAAITQLYYYWALFSKFAFWKDNQARNQSNIPLSVVICARNEAENLSNHLPEILNLDYPDYEVVVVNDCSYDSTKEILEEMEKKYSNLRITSLNEDNVYQHDKKFAVTIGIKAAKNEHIIFTDADCLPKSKEWVKEMISLFAPGKEIVLGYGAYKKENSFINKLIRFDTFFIGMHYFTAAIMGKPYMGVGRNMAYTKSLFFRNKGFASHAHIRSGDDDLFINKVANNHNIGLAVSPNSHTLSIPKDNFGDWFNQKRRHITTSTYYKSRDKAFLGLQFASSFLFYICFFVLIGFRFQPYIVLSLFLIRIISQLIIFRKAMEKLDEKDLLWTFFIYDLFLVFIYPLLKISNTFSEEPRWK